MSTQHESAALCEVTQSRQDPPSWFPVEAKRLLKESLRKPTSFLPTVDMAAIAMAGGYLARAVQEKIDCSSCISLMAKPASSAPSNSASAPGQRRTALPLKRTCACAVCSDKVHGGDCEQKESSPKAITGKRRERCCRTGRLWSVEVRLHHSPSGTPESCLYQGFQTHAY